ncbi:MAG: methyltransferase domain-containing protein [Balneolaceae bacterium]
MSCCNHCRDAGELFSDRLSVKELKRYRKKGPAKLTKLLLDGIRQQQGVAGKSLIDIGGGVGAISFELFEDGLAESIQVDASEAYLAASKKEAKKRGLDEKMWHRYGDFTELAEELEPADIVTLDRVICCYPDMEKLLTLSVQKARNVFAFSFPKKRWYVRTGLSFTNLYLKITGSDFRVYFYPPDKMDEVIRNLGFSRKSTSQTWSWEAAVYTRTG